MVVHVLVVFNLLVLNLPTEIYQTKKEIYLFKIEKYLESMINNIFKKLLDKITKCIFLKFGYTLKSLLK